MKKNKYLYVQHDGVVHTEEEVDQQGSLGDRHFRQDGDIVREYEYVGSARINRPGRVGNPYAFVLVEVPPK